MPCGLGFENIGQEGGEITSGDISEKVEELKQRIEEDNQNYLKNFKGPYIWVFPLGLDFADGCMSIHKAGLYSKVDCQGQVIEGYVNELGGNLKKDCIGCMYNLE